MTRMIINHIVNSTTGCHKGQSVRAMVKDI
jgi:hypothetical protein